MHPNTGAYLGSLVGLMVGSGRAHPNEYFPELLLPVSLSSQWDRATLHICRRPSSTSSLPWGHCTFPCVPMCTLLCVCPPRVESLFPPVLLKSCNQIPLAFKVCFSRNSSFHCRTPRLGSLTWGSEPSLQWVDFCGISVLQFVSHHPAVMGFDFIVIAPLLSSHCGFSFVFGCGVFFFGEFQCLSLNDCSAVSCDSGVLAKGSESTSFYSAILNQPPIYLLLRNVLPNHLLMFPNCFYIQLELFA